MLKLQVGDWKNIYKLKNIERTENTLGLIAHAPSVCVCVCARAQKSRVKMGVLVSIANGCYVLWPQTVRRVNSWTLRDEIHPYSEDPVKGNTKKKEKRIYRQEGSTKLWTP